MSDKTYYQSIVRNVPASVKTPVNDVLNKKFGTSTTYPPEGWPSRVNLLGKLPTRTATGAIAHFTDGADDVPIKSGIFEINPYQEGTGDPSPSNPRAIHGYTGMNVTHTGANLFNPNSEIVPHSTYGFFNLCPDNIRLSIQLFDKDDTVSLSGITFGFSKRLTENGAQQEINAGYNWIFRNGTDTGSRTNLQCDQFSFFPKTSCQIPKSSIVTW